MSVFSANLHCNHGDISSFARKKLMFCVISTVVFLANKSGGVFLPRVSGSARFFSCFQPLCKLGIFIKFS